MNLKTIAKKTKQKYDSVILFFQNKFGVHEGAVLALLLMLVFVTIGAVAGRPPRKRNLTTTPLLWAKLDGTLTDENSTGSTFAYSPGKPSTEMGVSIKEGDNIQYSPGSTIDSGSSVYENWNPNQGTMNVWVQSNWNGNDNTRHDIWNGDYGRIDTADANLQAYFKFDEGSEDFAFDSTSNSNIGYLHGPALSFDGSADYVDVGNVDNITTEDFSISAWIKSGSITGSAHPILTKKNFGYDVGYGVYMMISGGVGYLYGHIEDSTGATLTTIDGAVLNNNSWHFVVIVFDRDGNITRYVDGSQTGTQNTATRVLTISNSKKLRIGCEDSPGGYFNGQINNVRIYSRALSATEVGQHYVGNYADESGLVGYWPMDENQGQYVYDQSGNSNNGTLGADSGSSTDDPTWVNYAPGWSPPAGGEGRFGGALIFDGTDDEVEMGDIDF